MEEIYYTPKEAAHLMGVCVKTMYRWTSGESPQIKSIRKGSRLLFIPQSEIIKVNRNSRN